MKFKSLYVLSALFLGACCLTSCEEGTGENTDDLASVYWNKSAAFQMHLKGKVKVLVVGDSTESYTFNQSGNLVSTVYGQKETDYIYSSGRLTKVIGTWNWYTEQTSDTTLYTYATSGKYLPSMSFEVAQAGLIRNIASINAGIYLNRFVARGDSMLMLSSFQERYITNQIVEQTDTTSLTFNGGLYPVTMRSKNGVIHLTYASDGRFLTVEELSHDFYQSYSIVTTFKSTSDYLLPESVVRKRGNEIYNSKTFTYNDNEDVVLIANLDFDEEYSDYVYDANGNWISRSYRHKTRTTEWSEKVTETREITYWD